MHRGVRQHLAGVVVNDRVNLMRSDFDQLKATLTNCLRLGASSQNGEGHADLLAHLNGRVTYLESINPQKGQRLRRIFENISWA
jgi:RNA-directed DNA polymerase